MKLIKSDPASIEHFHSPESDSDIADTAAHAQHERERASAGKENGRKGRGMPASFGQEKWWPGGRGYGAAKWPEPPIILILS